tara:strand:+ start:330 stop:1310 length:981 start_codon:yes stop_codon:yes gene_type:complete
MLKSIVNRVRKGIRDIGSGAQDIARNNPEALALAAFIGMGGMPGGKPFLGNIGLPSFLKEGSTFRNIAGNIIGNLSKGTSGPLTHQQAVEGSGILGTLEKGSKLLGGQGIASVIASLLAKKQFDIERADSLAEKERLMKEWNYLNDLWGTKTGGSPQLEDKFLDLGVNVETGEIGDRVVDGKLVDFTEDEEGRAILSNATGGIAQLNVGGHPRNRMNFKIPVRRAYGGEMNGSSGVDPQIFDPRMSGKQMMNQIEKNPGITEFFPPKFGMIDGPGGPKDDKIPAMLSDGEFVFTAKAVDNAGGPRAMYNMMNKLDPESSKGRGIMS